MLVEVTGDSRRARGPALADSHPGLSAAGPAAPRPHAQQHNPCAPTVVVMRTSQRSSRVTAAWFTSCSTAARPRCRVSERPLPQFRQRARSLPARKGGQQGRAHKRYCTNSAAATGASHSATGTRDTNKLALHHLQACLEAMWSPTVNHDQRDQGEVGPPPPHLCPWARCRWAAAASACCPAAPSSRQSGRGTTRSSPQCRRRP